MFMDEDEVIYPLQKIRGLYMNGTLQLNAGLSTETWCVW